MSAFVNSLGQNWSQVGGWDDLRLNRMDFQPQRELADIWAIAAAPFTTDWWPGGGRFNGDGAIAFEQLQAVQWGAYDQASGAASRYAFAGYTRDAMGTIIPGVTVKVFRTSDDSLQGTSISDTLGFFFVNTLHYPDAHYLVAHKTATPDVDGVSVNTLIGI